MSGVTKKLISASGGVAGGFTAIEDVFSTYLYTGNGSTQTITNYIDLAGEGGLVWTKGRIVGGGTSNHRLVDTVRGATKSLASNLTSAEGTDSTGLTAFSSDGYTLGSDSDYNFGVGTNPYASWTFRKAPRFFDVVTYTGVDAARAINHNLGVVPGCIIIKRTNTASEWCVYHRGSDASAPEDYFVKLNNTDDSEFTNLWDGTAPTDTQFFLTQANSVNEDGGTYVAYLFAHDPLGPSGDGSDGLIDCGSYTGNGSSNGPEIDLGWEPQWILVKRADSADNWFMLDIMRGITTGGADPWLNPNTSGAEFITTDDYIDVTATGFKLKRSTGEFNANGGTYIYIAIRRGPMRAPESGTEVFAPVQFTTSPEKFITGFPVDFAIAGNAAGTDKWYWQSRLQGPKVMRSHSTAGEIGSGSAKFDLMDGYGTGFTTNYYSTAFRRAPEFFDVVAYTGNGTAGRTVPHNLGVAPEMMIVKRRNVAASWVVYAGDATDYLVLDSGNATADLNTMWNDTAPSESFFTVGTQASVNGSGDTYIAYLFATLAGVSKVGSYTGNGSSQTINCGFTTGARFILIKRTDSTGDWYVWDTARGIIAGNDPFLELNTTDAEVTSDDSIDPDSSGFIVNQTATTNVNVNAASYIFYAVS